MRFPANGLSIGLLFSAVAAVASTGPVVEPPIHPELARNAASEQTQSDQSLRGQLEPLDADGQATYLIRFVESPVSRYRGGVRGLAPTSVEATSAARLDARSPQAQAYRDWLVGRQNEHRRTIEQRLGRASRESRGWQVAINAISMRLSPAEARRVESLPFVAQVNRNTFQPVTADYGPRWIGAEAVWRGGQGISPDLQTRGEGVVIGVIDSGINMGHPMFAAMDADGYVHTNPLGEGNYLGWCDPSNPDFDPELVCNGKLIGVWDFAGHGPEDLASHGSHVAGAAAGNVVDIDFNGFGFAYQTRISGVAPRANIVSYTACIPSGMCSDDAVISAIEQAIIDGVDVLNESIGIGGDAFQGPKQQAYLGAMEAGIIAVRAAGNSGPASGTVGPEPPWTLSVAAMTHDRLLTASGTESSPVLADRLAGFSSRGPGSGPFFKPDLGAPGWQILSAYRAEVGQAETYGLMSGTSMASPHAAGAAALLRAARPDWMPSEVFSALAGTARWQTATEMDGSTVDPLDIGGGQIDLPAAFQTGLLLNESMAAYDNANPANGGDPRVLNRASLFDDNCQQFCSFQRSLRNPTDQTMTWEAEYLGSGTVTVSPARFALEPGESVTLTINADMRLVQTDTEWHQGRVVLSELASQAPDFNLPAALRSRRQSSTLLPSPVEIHAESISASPGQPIPIVVDLVGYAGGSHSLQVPLPAGIEVVPASLDEGLVHDAARGHLEWNGTMDAQISMEQIDTGAVGYRSARTFLSLATRRSQVVLGGLDFRFAGADEHSLVINERGIAWPGSIGCSAAIYPNAPLPTDYSEGLLLAPLWTELEMADTGHFVFAWRQAHAGKIWNIVEWENMSHIDHPDLRFTFQLWMEDGGEDLRFVYGPGDWENLPEATIGFQDMSRLQGLTHHFNDPATAPRQGDEYRLIYQPEQRRFRFDVIVDAAASDAAVLEATLATSTALEASAWTALYTAHPERLAFVGKMPDLALNEPPHQPIQVRVEDAGGRLVDVDGIEIQLSLAADHAGSWGALSGTVTATTVGGVAKFPDVQIDLAGDQRVLEASSDGLTAAQSPAFSVLPLWDCSRIAGLIESDCRALVQLALATDVRNWTNNDGWLETTPTDPCQAFGLGCSPNRVTMVNLEWNNLVGEIPPEIGHLTELTSLYMGSNQLSGSLPPEIGELTKLENLRLQNNGLSGPVPANWGQLTRLVWFDLDGNAITGPLPAEIGNWRSVVRLNISRNELDGSLPPEWGQLTSLRELRLWQNRLTGIVPAEWADLSNLETLDLAWNRLSGGFPGAVFGLAALQHLYLGFNRFSGPIPEDYSGMASLRSLMVAGNDLTGVITPGIGDIPLLEHLDLRFNGLTGSIPSWLGGKTGLKSLLLSGNRLVGEIPAELGQLIELQHLLLDGNRLHGALPEAITQLQNLRIDYVWALELAGNCLEAEGHIWAFVHGWDPGFPGNQMCRLTLSEVKPAQGHPNGGESILLHGFGFLDGVQAYLGADACLDLQRSDTHTLECRTPPGSQGTVDVTVRNPLGSFDQNLEGFKYRIRPEIFIDRFEALAP